MGIQNFLTFLDNSPTPWHAVETLRDRLVKEGFEELFEKDAWKLKSGQRYFIVRHGTSICAFTMPKNKPLACVIGAAHTDSPGFKLKPNAEYRKENMIMLGLEIYGGPLLTSWLNRDLGIAGRVICKLKGKLTEQLVNLTSTPLTIPQLAIHLDRSVNENGLVLHKQDHLAALAGFADPSDKSSFLENAVKESVKGEILGWDLFVYPLEKASLLGKNLDMVAGYRLDNLCCVYAIIKSLFEVKKSSSQTLKMAVFWDHEEIGSDTSQGAGSTFLPQILERIAGSREDYFRLLNQSLCVSCDAGHALHPNYPDKHEPRHQLFLNQGVILKSSAQYRYASDARSSAVIEEACKLNKQNLQRFTSRGDIPAGSTIGPITAHNTGMATVDVGIAMLSMHSAREIVGVKDLDTLRQLMTTVFQSNSIV